MEHNLSTEGWAISNGHPSTNIDTDWVRRRSLAQTTLILSVPACSAQLLGRGQASRKCLPTVQMRNQTLR